MKNKGLSAKIIIIPGAIIFFVIIFFVARQLISMRIEYKKDHAHLAQNFKIEIQGKPLPKIMYPLKSYIITTGGFCWLLSQSSIMSYLEPDIDFNTFVLYGGPTFFMAGRNESERYGPGLNGIHSFKNLGYTFYRGSTDPFHPPRNVFPDIELENFIYFKDADEEFLLAKKLLTAGIIPIVHIKGSFIALIGYDDKGIWLANPEDEKIAEEKKPKIFLEVAILDDRWHMTYENFFKDWKNDRQMFWYKKTGKRKTEAEIYKENKKNAQETPQNIETTIGILRNLSKNQSVSQLYTYDFDTPSTVALYDYFLKRGNNKLAQKYLEIAKTYEKARESFGPNPPLYNSTEFLIPFLTKIKPLYKEVASMWP